jgi:hypothetical protein
MPGLTAARRIELLEYLRGNYEFWAKLHLGPAGPSCTANAATETTRQQVLVDAAAIVGNLVEIVSNTLVVWTNVQTPGQDAIETLTDLSIWPDNGSGAQRTVTNGVTNGTTTITSASAAFVSADIGATVTGSADLPGGVTIASVTNGTDAHRDGPLARYPLLRRRAVGRHVQAVAHAGRVRGRHPHRLQLPSPTREAVPGHLGRHRAHPCRHVRDRALDAC